MNKKITIIDYDIVNLASVANALKKLEIPYEISGNPDVIKKATVLLLPGVGAARQGMTNLKRKGLDTVIVDQVRSGVPILGICCGMQLLFSYSEEGSVDCLNLIAGMVRKFDTNLKIPQIGWNTIEIQNAKIKMQNYNSKFKSLMNGIPNNSYCYFANSYICVPDDTAIISTTTDYDGEFCSVFEKENIFGAQFHPEKSGDAGMRILKNFWEVVCK